MQAYILSGSYSWVKLGRSTESTDVIRLRNKYQQSSSGEHSRLLSYVFFLHQSKHSRLLLIPKLWLYAHVYCTRHLHRFMPSLETLAMLNQPLHDQFIKRSTGYIQVPWLARRN